MRIGIVTKHLGLPVGFGTYAARLLDAFAAAPGDHEFFVYTPRRAAPRDDLGSRFTVRTLPVPPGLRSALAVWEHGVVPEAARRDRVDVLHYLHTAAPLRRYKAPVVVNVLDTIAWSLPGYALPRVYDRLAVRAIRIGRPRRDDLGQRARRHRFDLRPGARPHRGHAARGPAAGSRAVPRSRTTCCSWAAPSGARTCARPCGRSPAPTSGRRG